MRQSDVMVYLMTGFLDSGKTQFLTFTLEQDYFQIQGKTLLILCEEGEEEYDPKEMLKYGVVIEKVEDKEDLTEAWLEEMNRKHKPERVVVEYNGMWPVSDFEKLALPAGWKIEQKIATVDASTFQMYLTNLKPLFVEMVKGAELVLFNRCEDRGPLAGYRRSVKVVSPQAEVIFEDENGEVDNIFEDEVPYDLNAPVIEIRREDYGIWYVDMMDNLDKYVDKTVRFKGQVLKSRELNAGFFVPGRMAMTCCADDVRYYGYPCKAEMKIDAKTKSWMQIRARFEYEAVSSFGNKQPVLYLIDMEPATEPEDKVVYLG